MSIKIKNWKLAIFAFLFIGIFSGLGYWQIVRAKQKKILIASFAERKRHTPLTVNQLDRSLDLRFYRASLSGTFDNQHTFLLDNKIHHGKVGYEVYTPFKAEGMAMPILIDRGFVPITTTRDDLPTIKAIRGRVTVRGLINLPPTYVAFGKIHDATPLSWPNRIEFINLTELAAFLGEPLFPYILNIEEHDPAAYAIEWQIVTMGPEKHMGYAVQWFALALTLLILFVTLNRGSAKK